MNIIITLDTHTGHLFHDLELYIVAFERLKNSKNECKNIYFLKPNENFEEERICNKWNHVLCFKLFKRPNFNIIDNIEPSLEKNSLIINRKYLDHKNINKGFASSIVDFPTKLWSNCFDNGNTNNKFKILYAVRQTTSRRLDDLSHEQLCFIVNSYNGTICDMGSLSIEEQMNVFRNHNVVIGVHGNNLSGIMWMKPNSFVFEILPFKFT